MVQFENCSIILCTICALIEFTKFGSDIAIATKFVSRATYVEFIIIIEGGWLRSAAVKGNAAC